MMTVKEIVIAALKEMGADGLCCPGECGCGLDDLMPCFDGACSVCVPAKAVPVPEELQGDYDQYFEPMTDEEIAANLAKKLCHGMGGCHRQQGSDGPHPGLHVHSFDIPRSHKMGGDEDEPQKPPEVRA
jgi:hypothetical protein